MPHLCTLPLVSVLNDQADARFPVAVYAASVSHCERFDEGDCVDHGFLFGDDDANSPIFCAKHFRELHLADGQSHIEPMTNDEFLYFTR